MIPTTINARNDSFMGHYTFPSGDVYWVSQRLLNVKKILDHKWVYGDYIVASTENINGTYSMWQSNTLGRTWANRLTISRKIVVFTTYDLGHIIMFTDNNKMYESKNSGYSYTLKSSDAPNALDVAVTTPIGSSSGNFTRDIVTHNGDSLSLSQDLGNSFIQTLDLSDNYTQSELLHPAVAISGSNVLASAGSDILQSSFSGDIGTWSVYSSFGERQYVRYLCSSYRINSPSYIGITDNRPNNNSGVYHSEEATSWNNTLILAAVPKNKPTGYSIKTNTGDLLAYYIMNIRIPKSGFDQILYKRWKNAIHPKSGAGYNDWVAARPVISTSTALVNVSAVTTDGGRTWEIAQENTPMNFTVGRQSSLMTEYDNSNAYSGGGIYGY